MFPLSPLRSATPTRPRVAVSSRLRVALSTLWLSLLGALVPPAAAQSQLASSMSQSGVQAAPSATSLTRALTPVYRLQEDASLVQGCFPPCLCPIQLGDDLRGTFELRPLPTANPLFRTFAVRQVNWLVRLGGVDQRVIGSGIYRVANLPLGPLHELVLDLVIGDEHGAPVRFDSGLVPGGQRGRFPAIDIQIDANDLSCFDTLIHVRARSVPRTQLVPYELKASSSYQEGCLDPCLCPLYLERPVVGNFALVRIFEEANAVEFGVVELDWAILPAPPSPLPYFSPVSGSGIYRVEGPFGPSPSIAGSQRMILDLDVEGTPDRWDSGPVPGVSLPDISIDLAVNGFFCYDRIFAVRAAPL